MILWINGAFGAGKTTLAQELHRRLPDAMAFDPEVVGFVLTMFAPAPDTGDFPDMPLWRTLVADFIVGLRANYDRTLIVPMSLLNTAYREEIFGLIEKAGETIVHVYVDVRSDELRRRINAQILTPDDPARDAEARAFRLKNVERALEARAALPSAALVLRGDEHTPAQLADAVLTRMAP